MTIRLLSKTWAYKMPRKKKKKVKTKLRKKPQSKIESYAIQLQKNTPQAELWFRKNHKIHINDLFNIVFGPYIPDIINKPLKYIIEIDEAHHEQDDVKFNDFKKDKYYQERGYKVFRIKAYCQLSLLKFKADFEKYLTTLNEDIDRDR